MHEYSLVDALVERVEAEARQRGAVAIRRVVVSLGELAGVEPELFRSAFEFFRPRAAWERATLELTAYPARWSCPSCGSEFSRGQVLRCGACQRPARMDERSGALLLESIELEVP
jgi:hydrogenase nickel incorporation protein HypA/HybF